MLVSNKNVMTKTQNIQAVVISILVVIGILISIPVISNISKSITEQKIKDEHLQLFLKGKAQIESIVLKQQKSKESSVTIVDTNLNTKDQVKLLNWTLRSFGDYDWSIYNDTKYSVKSVTFRIRFYDDYGKRLGFIDELVKDGYGFDYHHGNTIKPYSIMKGSMFLFAKQFNFNPRLIYKASMTLIDVEFE